MIFRENIHCGFRPSHSSWRETEPGQFTANRVRRSASYLGLDTSYCTNEQFKNVKSLKAYNELVSGIVTYVQGLQISDKYVVIGKV